MTFWRWLSTSRYTRSLEEQVEELKREKMELKAEIARLNLALVPQLRQMAREDKAPTIEPRKVTSLGKPQPQSAKAGNWLQAKEAAEQASDIRFDRYDPKAEGHKANSQGEP